MSARIWELERDCAEARDRAALLGSLQTAFTTIAVTRTPQEVIAHMLRTAYEPLGFRRGIYFDADRERGIEARWQIDGGGAVEPSSEVADLRPGGSLLHVLRSGRLETGVAGELSAPLVDVRGWYVLSPVVQADRTVGALYLDDHRRGARPREWETDLARSLTTIASVSLANSVRFATAHELATRDPLTGLLNRRALNERLLQELDACGRDDRRLTFVMIDVDDFKNVNDTYGHARGDEVLKNLGATLQQSLRLGDVAARFAGDEFVVLLTDVDVDLARALVARLSRELCAAGLRCSIGAALFPRDAEDAASLLAAADRALYATKASGKNSYGFA